MFTKDNQKRTRKKLRVRKKLSGSAVRPRISVFRSNTQIYAQVIDDGTGKTLAAASSLSKEIAEDLKKAKGKVAKSKIVGSLLAKKAVEAGIKSVVFDRSGYDYHGRIKAVADGAREGGLEF